MNSVALSTREPQCGLEMTQLMNATQRVRSLTVDLRARLSYILRDEPSSPPTEAKSLDANLVGLADALRERRREADEASETLEDILRRIEL
jgi:hypothetical protein